MYKKARRILAFTILLFALLALCSIGVSAEKISADEEAARSVDQIIDAIGDNITLTSASAITTARTVYDLLTENQKTLVTNYQKLVDAEAKLAELVTADDKAKADEVIAKINAIGEVTLEAEGRIVAARIAYTLLTNQQRALVTNYATLLAAEAKLAELKGADSNSTLDQTSADAVAALIDKIGTVTLDSEMYISAARNAYNALTDAQKLLVENYATLVAAERTFVELKIAQEVADAKNQAAAAVDDKINAIGEVTADSGNLIRIAREAYNALTEDQKTLVKNMVILEVAEKAYLQQTSKDAGDKGATGSVLYIVLSVFLVLSVAGNAVLVVLLVKNKKKTESTPLEVNRTSKIGQ